MEYFKSILSAGSSDGVGLFYLVSVKPVGVPIKIQEWVKQTEIERDLQIET